MPTSRRLADLLKYQLLALAPGRLIRMFLAALETRQEIPEAAGYHVYPRAYFSPLLLKEEIDLSVLDRRRRLPGIAFNEQQALTLLASLRPYVPELESLPCEHDPASPFWFSNNWFNDFDAATLYGLLRDIKPKRYVEVGCGFSSLISSRALSRNAAEAAHCDAVFADPKPRLDIAPLLSCGQLLEQRMQDLPMELFTGLDAGDVLFIDTSHVIKFQSDVVHALVTILPALKPGVWVHVHDVFTPYDYPKEWVTQSRFSNNEQYALEALLSGGDRFSVVLPLYLLWKEHTASLNAFFPRGRIRPHSFWMRKAVAA